MTQGDGSATDRAWLADWRRRVAGLYEEIRALAAMDPVAAWDHWRKVREGLFRDHPQSPLKPEIRATFRATYFDYDPALRFDLVMAPAPPPAPGALALTLPNSGDDASALSFSRIGRLTIPFADGPADLSVFWMAGYAGGLFIPFRDGTNDHETYGAGRYLIDSAPRAPISAATRPPTGSRSTSTSPSSRRAPSIRVGPARWHPRRTAWTDRSGPANAWPDAAPSTGARYLRPLGPRTVGGTPPHGTQVHHSAVRFLTQPAARRKSVCSGRATSGSSAGSRHMSRAHACSNSIRARSYRPRRVADRCGRR